MSRMFCSFRYPCITQTQPPRPLQTHPQGEAAAQEITAAATTAANDAEGAAAARRASSSSSLGPPAVQHVEALRMDLADLKSVEAFAVELGKRTKRVDILVGGRVGMVDVW